ncbi:MAG: hypothetical protein R3361_07955, partial [Aequorivita vladivostokensis]|nr:hypothetical protein [Aequorivita vladivostokensis]
KSKPKKKLLPCGAWKREIFAMYPKAPDSVIRDAIFEAQSICYPNKDAKKLKNGQWLSREVVQKIIDLEGVPAGYQNKFK